MLPFFTRVDEAQAFIDAIAGRADVSLLVETAQAAMRLHEIVRLPRYSRHPHRLERPSSVAQALQPLRVVGLSAHGVTGWDRAGCRLRFGFGGVGRLNDRRLPIPSDLVYAQYAHPWRDSALVSRVFITSDGEQVDLSVEVARCRARIAHWVSCQPEERMAALAALRLEVAKRFPGA